MKPKPQAMKIARTIAGFCIAAGLIYFLYSDKSPPVVTWLIILAVVFFFALKRRSGVYDKSPYFRRLAMVSSRKPLRDLGLALACFLATLAVTLAIVAGVKNNVLPDNKVTAGFLVVLIFAGIAGVLLFMSGVIGRAIYGPPPS
jgi:FtsH-binding integral membrane protein